MDFYPSSKSKSQRKRSNRNEAPLLKPPDTMLITKDVMLPVKLSPPPGKLFSMPRIGMKHNLKITGSKRLGSQSLKPFLDPEIVENNSMESSPINTRSKNSSSRTINDIPTSTKTERVPFPKHSSYCLPRSNLLEKKSYQEKIHRVPLAREEQSSRPNLRIFVDEKRDRSNFDPDPKGRETDEPLIQSSGNSLSSMTASLETGSRSSSRVSGALGDSLPKLPELNIISSSESEFSVSNPEQFERMIISNDINNQCNGINIVEKIETKPEHEIVTSTSESVIENNKESIEIEVDTGFEVYGSKDKCRNWIETRNLITTDESDRLHGRETKKVIVNGEMNNNLLVSDEKYRSYTEAVENDVKTDDQILVDVECLVQLLIANVSVLEDSNNSDRELEKVYSQTNLQNPYSLDEERSGNDSDERQPAIVGLRYSIDDLPSSVSPIDKCNNSCINDEPIIDSEEKYSWQRIDPVTPNVSSNSDFHFIKTSNDQIEAKYSWQIIDEKYKEFNDILNSDEDAFVESESREFKNNIDRKNASIFNNSKLTCTEDLCMNEPEYQYSWQKLTSKYLAETHKEDRFVNRSQPARDIDLNIPMNADTESMKKRFPIKETFMPSSNSISSYTVDENYKGGKDIGRIVVNSPLNNIISSMLPDIRVINRHPGFDNTSYLSSNLNSESNKSSTRYSSMSSIKQIIASLNEMVKTQKNMLDSYVRDHISEENADLEKSAPAAPDRTEKVEIFPSTLHVLGDYIVRDIRPEDINNPKDFSNKKIPDCTNFSLKNALSDTNLTRSNDRSSQLPLDFRSMKSCPISFETLNFVPKARDLEKDYKDEIFPSNGGSLLPVLELNSILIDNDWDPGIAAMDKPVVSMSDSGRDNEGKIDAAGSLPYTKSVGLLKPRLQISFSEVKEAGDSNTREDELATRLESAMSRLKQCEQQVDANWNLDYSVLDAEEKISQEKVENQLPKQVEEHIKDIIQSAEEYLAKLEEQLKDLRTADDQIINSSERTFKDIDETYQLLMDNLCQEINKRRNLVRLETEVFKYEGLAPLRACKQEVDAQIRSTQHLIVLTEMMLTNPSTFNRDRLGKIITATSHMGRIPAVPMPEELPYVTFSPPNEDVKKEIADRISCLGCVLRMGPAQFTEVCERPAGLQLKWHIVDPEFASEEQTFVVQKALGEISEPTSPAFETVYIGSETSCFVRDLPVDHPITLRVGIQVSDTAWSVHRIAQTSIPAYSWDPSNSDYLITNSGRIATKVTQNISTLLSRGAQLGVDHIIEFKFLEAASGGSDEGIGLVYDPSDTTESLKRIGALLITPNGNIFIDGDEKLMQLPKMQLGTRIIFISEQKDEETLRMTIECANKAVTYDWTVQKPLHFAARFIDHNKWNFMVK